MMPRGMRRNFGAVGAATISLEETGIVIDAEFHQFDIPFLVSPGFSETFCAPSRRTIPYSSIIRHSPPKWFRGHHQILYQLPDRSKRLVCFRLDQSTPDRRDDDFETRLGQGRTIASLYLQA